jgi:hypothetical protein
LDKLEIIEAVQAIGYAETAQVEVKGVCIECAAKQRQTG